ncbi:MAG: Fe-S cluster assembly protein HesB [Anaeromyxobacteraceae bacterium]
MHVPPGFDLALVVRSHGWYDLAPWSWDEARRVLARPLLLSTGRAVFLEAVQPEPGQDLVLRVLAQGRPTGAESREAADQLRTCLSLDHDLGAFQALAAALEAERAAGRRRHLPDLRWALARGAGRLLRSPTVWEDAVKTLCTTNCSWGLTRVMVTNLCERLGEEAPGGARCFPTPAAMAAKPERFYREKIRAGYRAPFLRTFAREVAAGRLDLEAMRSAAQPTDALAERIGALDGFGPYATEHLLKLLGRFDHLALDSWIRGKLTGLRGRRKVPSDRALRSWYAPYGTWAGLAMWLEVTADWHGEAPTWPPAPAEAGEPAEAKKEGGT